MGYGIPARDGQGLVVAENSSAAVAATAAPPGEGGQTCKNSMFFFQRKDSKILKNTYIPVENEENARD